MSLHYLALVDLYDTLTFFDDKYEFARGCDIPQMMDMYDEDANNRIGSVDVLFDNSDDDETDREGIDECLALTLIMNGSKLDIDLYSMMRVALSQSYVRLAITLFELPYYDTRFFKDAYGSELRYACGYGTCSESTKNARSKKRTDIASYIIKNIDTHKCDLNLSFSLSCTNGLFDVVNEMITRFNVDCIRPISSLSYNETPLLSLCRNYMMDQEKCYESISKLIGALGLECDPGRENNGTTAMWVCCKNGYWNVARLLIKSFGRECGGSNKTIDHVLELVRQKNRQDIVQLLEAL